VAQQRTYQPEIISRILASIGRQIAAVEADYKAALTVAAERLQESQRRLAAGQGARATSQMLVEDATVELDSETAMALHKLESRLDRLTELRDEIKVDPELVHFVVALLDTRAQSAASSAAVAERAPDAVDAAAPRSRRISLMLVTVVAVLALVAGWLLSIVLPAVALLPH
jgi:hypothetical protein